MLTLLYQTCCVYSPDKVCLFVYYLSLCVCAQLCLMFGNPMDCSPHGSSVHGIFQARILEQVAISISNLAKATLNYNLFRNFVIWYIYTHTHMKKSAMPHKHWCWRFFGLTLISFIFFVLASVLNSFLSNLPFTHLNTSYNYSYFFSNFTEI